PAVRREVVLQETGECARSGRCGGQSPVADDIRFAVTVGIRLLRVQYLGSPLVDQFDARFVALEEMQAGPRAIGAGDLGEKSKPLGGVTVSITSPALQGIRTAITGPAGGYSFANLLPGDYLATFEFPGMQSVHTRVSVDVSTSTRADAELKAGVFEQVTVTAAPPAAESAEVATNFKME